MDMMRIAELLIDKIRRDYPGDVSLVHVHGSYAYGDTHDRSDIDLYLVPKTQHGYRLGCTFILNGVGCDLWPLPWERLERIANHEEKISSIITEGHVLYFGSQEDQIRFEGLKARALETRGMGKRAASAAEKLEPAYKAWFHMQNAGTLAEVRARAIHMIYTISFALAELNGISIKRGRKLLKAELLAMPLVPVDFEALYDTAFTNPDRKAIQAAYGALLRNTGQLIAQRQKELLPVTPFREALAGWYEEAVQCYNKIYHGCETGDPYTPLFACAEFSAELESVLQNVAMAPEVPDIVALYDLQGLDKMAEAVRQHQAGFERLLHDQGVRVRRFASFEEVEAFLDGL